MEKLACPVCGEALADRGERAACPNGHSFDYARSGYLNLTSGGGARRRIGDSPEMVRARARFLGGGFLDPVADAVAAAAEAGGEAGGAVAEIGSGTGHYLDRAHRRLAAASGAPRCGFGIDLSVAASSHAARAHPALCFAVADVERGVPLLDRSVAVLLSVFSPRPAAECARVTGPGAVLVAAFATERHLAGLRRSHNLLSVHPGKLEDLSERLGPWFSLADANTVEYEVALRPEEAADAIAMGPSARHRDPGATPGGEPLAERVSVTVASFERRSAARYR